MNGNSSLVGRERVSRRAHSSKVVVLYHGRLRPLQLLKNPAFLFFSSEESSFESLNGEWPWSSLLHREIYTTYDHVVFTSISTTASLIIYWSEESIEQIWVSLVNRTGAGAFQGTLGGPREKGPKPPPHPKKHIIHDTDNLVLRSCSLREHAETLMATVTVHLTLIWSESTIHSIVFNITCVLFVKLCKHLICVCKCVWVGASVVTADSKDKDFQSDHSDQQGLNNY